MVELSKFQKEILKYFNEKPTGNIFINALAGTGKSFIVCKMLETVNNQSLYLAFNKSIAEEFKGKITNDKVKIYTIHGLCNAVLNQNLKDQQKRGALDNLKMYKIVDYIFDNDRRYKSNFNYKNYVKDAFVQLYGLVRLNFIDMENEYYEYHVRKIIKEHRIFESAEFTFDTSKCYDVIKSMDKYSMNTFEKDGTYDFTDMLYITLKKLQEGKWKVPGWYLFSNICVDECQDLSTIQVLLIKHFKRTKDSRIVAVGDKNQAIYMFSGANSNSYNLIKKLYDPMQEFDLPINYRCPKKHLELVNMNFDIPIKPREDAPEGTIEIINKRKAIDLVKPNDFIIGRKNKWLFPILLELIEAGKPVYIKDASFVDKLKKVIKSSKATRLSDLVYYCQTTRKKLEAKAEEKEEKADTESYDVLELMIDSYVGKYSNYAVSAFEAYMNSILNTTSAKDCIFVSSIHCCKGLEANNVFVLNLAKPCTDGFLSAEQNQQEINLSYIAITRAKDKLFLVKPEGEEYA